MEEKVLKNPGYPGGRKDWKGRAPRWRLSLTEADSKILIEVLEYFIFEKGLSSDDRYMGVLMRIKEASEHLQKPLTSSVYHYPLFEGLLREDEPGSD